MWRFHCIVIWQMETQRRSRKKRFMGKRPSRAHTKKKKKENLFHNPPKTPFLSSHLIEWCSFFGTTKLVPVHLWPCGRRCSEQHPICLSITRGRRRRGRRGRRGGRETPRFCKMRNWDRSHRSRTREVEIDLSLRASISIQLLSLSLSLSLSPPTLSLNFAGRWRKILSVNVTYFTVLVEQ